MTALVLVVAFGSVAGLVVAEQQARKARARVASLHRLSPSALRRLNDRLSS